MADHEKEPNAPAWVKVLVVLHVVAITIWAIPRPSEAISSGERKPAYTQWIPFLAQKHLQSFQPLQAYLFVSGFWQYWDMFSPNPAQIDSWADAIVTYRDGTKKTYQYPRIYSMPLPQKLVGERYRKFYERVNQEKYSYLWPPFAQRIAFLNDNPQNPPVQVELRRHWLQIPTPSLEPVILEVNALLAKAYDPNADPAAAAEALAQAKAIVDKVHEPSKKDLKAYFPQIDKKPEVLGYKGQPYAEYVFYIHNVDQKKLEQDRKGIW